MIFQYEAVNRSGGVVTGELEATGTVDALLSLRRRQLMATQLQEQIVFLLGLTQVLLLHQVMNQLV